MTATPRSMRDEVLFRLHDAMSRDDKLFVVSADFGAPMLDRIRADFPQRFVNVGIAEQNLINVSAGLALEGFSVVAYGIAPFITMRCHEQIRVNLALLSEVRPMNVMLMGVGAGYSYAVSGPTHQCYEDLTVMRALPNVSLYSPADAATAAALAMGGVARQGIKYLRLDAQALPALTPDTPDIARGYRVHHAGRRLCFVATGYMVHTALAAAKALEKDGYSVGVVDLFDLTGADFTQLMDTLAPYESVISLEEGFVGRGGLDALLAERIRCLGAALHFEGLGVAPGYRFDLGPREVLHSKAGIGLTTVMDRAVALMAGRF